MPQYIPHVRYGGHASGSWPILHELTCLSTYHMSDMVDMLVVVGHAMRHLACHRHEVYRTCMFKMSYTHPVLHLM